jgi:hypothetical protein
MGCDVCGSVEVLQANAYIGVIWLRKLSILLHKLVYDRKTKFSGIDVSGSLHEI